MQLRFRQFDLIVPAMQKKRLSTTCFRGEKKAGCFIDWRSVESLFADIEVKHSFEEGINEILEKEGVLDKWSFTIKCSKLIGWSSTIPFEELYDVELVEKPLNKSSWALFVNSKKVRSRLTDLITFVISFQADNPRIVFLHSIYPGRDVGDLIGDVSAKTGLAFFDWETKGEK